MRDRRGAKPMFAEMMEANTPSLIEVRVQFAKQTGRLPAPNPRFEKSSPYLPWTYLRKFLRNGCCVICDGQPHRHFKTFSRLIGYGPTRVDPPDRGNPTLPQDDDTIDRLCRQTDFVLIDDHEADAQFWNWFQWTLAKQLGRRTWRYNANKRVASIDRSDAGAPEIVLLAPEGLSYQAALVHDHLCGQRGFRFVEPGDAFARDRKEWHGSFLVLLSSDHSALSDEDYELLNEHFGPPDAYGDVRPSRKFAHDAILDEEDEEEDQDEYDAGCEIAPGRIQILSLEASHQEWLPRNWLMLLDDREADIITIADASRRHPIDTKRLDEAFLRLLWRCHQHYEKSRIVLPKSEWKETQEFLSPENRRVAQWKSYESGYRHCKLIRAFNKKRFGSRTPWRYVREALRHGAFIAHSYKDSTHIPMLRRVIGRNVELLEYPPINATPDEYVSSPLIEEITRLKNLILVNGDNAASSFWVWFELTTAKRLGKPTWFYDTDRRTLTRDRSGAERRPEVAFFYPNELSERARQVEQWMFDERNVGFACTLIGCGPYGDFDYKSYNQEWQSWNGTFLLMISRQYPKIPGHAYAPMRESLRYGDEPYDPLDYHRSVNAAVRASGRAPDISFYYQPGRVLFLTVDGCTLDWLPDDVLNLMSDRRLDLIDIGSPDGSISKHRMDDLMVRIHWRHWKTINIGV
jgi:hypothetical protein